VPIGHPSHNWPDVRSLATTLALERWQVLQVEKAERMAAYLRAYPEPVQAKTKAPRLIASR
jgi:hypothetical protein